MLSNRRLWRSPAVDLEVETVSSPIIGGGALESQSKGVQLRRQMLCSMQQAKIILQTLSSL